jgi:AraC-like DNA-binding protein
VKKSSALRDHAIATLRFGDVCISELRIARHSSAGHSVPQADAGPLRELVFVLSGELSVRYRGQPLRLRADEWSVFDADQILLSAAEDTCALVMTIPAAGSVRTAIHSSTAGVDKVLFACVKTARDVAGGLTLQARAELGNSLIDLAALALREKTAPPRRVAGRRIMCERVKGFVRHHLRESSLSIDEIARTFNCTKRYLHKVFSEDERSLNQFIWDLRLDRCSRDLASPDLLERSITEIAFGWGFRSTPHFSRVFRQRFGVSPSSWRTANLPAPALAPQISEWSAARVRAPSGRFQCDATHAAYSDSAS